MKKTAALILITAILLTGCNPAAGLIADGPTGSLTSDWIDDISVPEESSELEESEPEEQEISEPEDSEAEDSQPEDSEPEESQPEASQPEDAQPEESRPETSKSESSKSESSKSENSSQSSLPTLGNPANWSSVYVGTTEQELQAREVAKKIADSIGPGTDLQRIQKATEKVYQYRCKQREDKNIYMTAYSVFFMGESCCWGYTSALGMVLDYMGYSWRRGNYGVDEDLGAWVGSKHQWVIVNMDGHVGYADAQVGYAYYGAYGGSRDSTFALSHGSSSKETVVTEPTCEGKGLVRYSCSVCGDSTEMALPALGHDSVAFNTVAPTETTPGYTEYSCTRCGISYEDDFTHATKRCEETGQTHSWSRHTGAAFGDCFICGASEEEYFRQNCIDGSGEHHWERFGASPSTMWCPYCRVQAPIDESLIDTSEE